MIRLRISLVLIPVAIAVVVGIYVYSLWASERRRSAEIPVEAASVMMRDLLVFHEKRGSFPIDLKQLEGVVWEKKSGRRFSIDDRALSHRNYYYLYTRAGEQRFSLWAVPMGKLREEAPTWFLTVTPESCRRWKGPALPLEQVGKIKTTPSIAELGILGLSEQAKMDFPRK